MQSMLDLLGATDNHYSTSEELKTELSIMFVMEDYNPAVRFGQGSGNYSTTCPFHEDSSPSFDVYGENLDRWGCHPCNLNADVFVLINMLYEIGDNNADFIKIKDKARSILADQRRSGWSGPTKGEKKVFDQTGANTLILSSMEDEHAIGWNGLFLDLQERNPGLQGADADSIRTYFSIGSMGQDAIIPYYNRDNLLIAFKRRRIGGKTMAASGANFKEILYAEWLDKDKSKPVLLCEGESDVWAATSAVGGEYAVLGIPTGAGTPATQAYTLAGRHVLLAFDGDITGRRALQTWSVELLKSDVKSVRVVVMPDGMDLAKSTNIKKLIGRTQVIRSVQTDIGWDGNGLVRRGKGEKGEHEQISNWYFEPRRQLIGDEGDAWEGVVMPEGTDGILSSDNLTNKTTLVSWAASVGSAFFGNDIDTQKYKAGLQAVRPYLATGHTSKVAGLHDNHFIYPGGSIGPDYWVYNTTHGDVEMHKYTTGIIEGDHQFLPWLELLRTLHLSSVMDPIIAWLAVAPLRSLISPFPTLTVLGGSGTGKTTLIDEVLRQMSGTCISLNLRSTTPFAISAMAGSTNAFPVWFDEYRPGADKSSLTALDQTVRDAYDGHGYSKGGGVGHWSNVQTTTAKAPLIVTGEDAFTETSHLERIIPVRLRPEGKNAEMMQVVKKMGVNGWAKGWLQYLQWKLESGEFDNLVIDPYNADLPPRMQNNLGVLMYGWRLLQDRAVMGGGNLGEPDFSSVIKSWTEDKSSNPIVDALEWCLEEVDAVGFITKGRDDDGFLYVKCQNFVSFIKRVPDGYVLPGKQEAVKRYMIDHLGGELTRYSIGEVQSRCIRIPLAIFDK